MRGQQLTVDFFFSNKSLVPDKDATTLCFDEVVPVRSNCCDCSVDVPYFGGGVLHCNMVADLNIGQGVGVWIILHR